MILSLLAFSFTSVAGTDLKKMGLPNNRVITITGHPDYPPVIWTNKETKKFQGIAIEMMQMIFNEIDVKVVFINVDNWARAQEEVKSGRIDILLPPYKTEERLPFYNYATEPFIQDETVVFVRKGKEFKFENFQDLLKFPGTAIINDSFGSDFDKFELIHKNITRLSTTEQCFRFVDKNRARYIIAGLNSGLATLVQLHWEDRFVVLPKRVITTGMYAPISLKSKWNIPEVNNYLKEKFAEYNRKGIIKKLEKKYLALLKKENKESKILLNKSTKTSNGPT
ncbi:transporter substrate-binding domain-containing protein [Bacteriovorax sp. PP10]|uniref:Transporter substrate-binding domain-containing protein n=1 Tax=Bacteriovorax antarcticus TaxID=3088717 RepID=A0ABU5VVP9_9BACT|nr:transporter substrate-binding domain-containing protein [Bacteriovorax sp. PP10]MEA9356105.1 transporter substrate-binding domain-containing protein [Bacteriovorax sp. PP10]